MTTRIDKTITGYRVLSHSTTIPDERPKADIIQMHERLLRPQALSGSTYKIKTPIYEHALYVTINDIVLNEGTEHEQRRPFEIFINSKNMEQFQWIVALTLIISAVFRKGGEFTFLVEELRSVFDPRGGYYKPGGQRIPSLVAEIGDTIETHLKNIHGLQRPESDEQQQLHAKNKDLMADETLMANASYCSKCGTYKVIYMEGCDTCLNCGHSRCG